MTYRLRAWTLGIVLLAALSPPARAAWTLVSADSPVTVVRATNVFALGAGESLRADDLIQSPRQGVVQIQDDNGTLVALGAQSRVMLQANARIALLRGWMKIAYACKAASCPQRVVETERGAIRLSRHGRFEGERLHAAFAEHGNIACVVGRSDDRRRARAAGFYGKIRTHGDFVGRGLSAGFVAQWDASISSACSDRTAPPTPRCSARAR